MTQLTTTPAPASARSGRPSPAAGRTGSQVARADLLGHPVALTVDGPGALLDRAVALLQRLSALWDVRRRDSDLHRLLVRPACVLDVSAETVLLAQRTLADAGLRSRLGLPAGGGGVVHARRNRVGLLPESSARAGQLLLATAVDLVVEQLVQGGATRALVQVGSTSRAYGDDVPPVRLELPGLARDVALADEALAVAVQPSHVHSGAATPDGVVAVAVHAPTAGEAQSLADAALLLPAGRAVPVLARSTRGGLVLHPTGGWTSTSGARTRA